MASSGLPTPRRSKTMPTEGHMTKFLYSILKQLDLKPIDWSLVATELEISNGHAARMRYSRFKQQMEGTVSVPRAAKQQPKKGVGKGDMAKGAKLGKEKAATISSGKGGESFVVSSKKRRASDQMVKQEMADSNPPVMRRQQMAESSSSSSFPPIPAKRMMAPNGMMLPVSSINNSNSSSNSTPFQYAVPLHSPGQMTVSPDEMMMMMMNHQYNYQQPSSHPHYVYDSINNADYTTDPFAQDSWNHHEYCFSGCCNPPPYPSSPNMYPSYQATLPTLSTSSTPFSSQQQQQPQIHPQLLQPQNVWVPVKQEGGGEGVSDELLVKVETGGDSEMRVDE
ncbi:hypothetical protein PISL3812_06821 [Talaromyces islandicus]|uniref:Myb-like DNA-binding domain-containing protein n=1 Tax=Talaromyces islandicus TaxID=28573 RepID=A0A0U1M317_TALIS|nr:hypothetical protein PISL3812_06821 [Talaromyces islandicus]